METMTNISAYADGIAVVPCAASAIATLEVRGAAARELTGAVTANRWFDATRGMKRDGFAPAHTQGSPAWSPPL
ncbi:hypothetical protein [Nocardioides ultimimeridianus]